MTIFSRTLNFLIVALALVLPALTLAQAPTGEPLVIVRFNQQRVYFDQQLYGAIAKAVAVKPDVMFDVVSYAPENGNATDKQWQAVAGRNTRSVIQAMNGMGVPMERISVIGESKPGLKFDETHVFVH